MVTESVAAVEPATPATGMSYGARLALTVLLLSLYVLGHRVPLPFVDTESYGEAGLPVRVNLMVLGITPLFTGFLLVEAFSVITSSGRRLRVAGPAGREKLNRAALAVSFLMCALQGWGFVGMLAMLRSPAGLPVVNNPGAAVTAFIVATLLAVTAVLFVGGSFLSEFGIGNGFSLLVLTDILWMTLEGLTPWFEGDAGVVAASDPMQGVGVLLVGAVAAMLIRHMQKAEATRTPPFPQGIVPVIWAGSLVSSPWFLPRFFEDPSDLPWFMGAVAVLVAVPFLSCLTFHLFSSRRRLEANLSEPEEVLAGLAETLHRRLLVSTAVLTVGMTALVGWIWAQPATFMASFAFLDLVLIVVILFDLRDQFLFLRRNGATPRLVQLDNVHFSYRLVALLEEKGIDALARAHHHRALFFFFGPLFKIDVFVPKDQLDEAQAVLAELELAREIKVF